MDKGPSNITLQLPYLRVVDLQEESEAHADDTFSNAGEDASQQPCVPMAQALQNSPRQQHTCEGLPP
jgi:hypothetical protein